MNERFLLDTNTISAALLYRREVLDLLIPAQSLYVPAVVLGELYHGAYKSARRDVNLAVCRSIARNNAILSCDAHTADVYGRIVADLESRGQRIPANDIWIAALAIQHNLTLLTRDAHFDRASGLSAVQW
jgi:tRNA(fMet)-specific endonuclease VapC